MNILNIRTSRSLILMLGFGVILLFAGCNQNYTLTFLVSEDDELVMTQIANEINSHSRFEISVISEDSLTEVNAIEAILDRKYDITTVDNTLDYKKSKKNMRTVVPFFHEVLVVLSRHQLKQRDIDSLLRAGDYLILTKELEELDFYKRMIPNYNGDSTINYRIEDHFNLEKDLEFNELLLFFTGKENYELGQLLFNEKAYLYSLDGLDARGNGSFIEGFCRSYKKTTPYVLSRYAFGIVLEEPIFTVAVHELLVSTVATPSDVVYDLIQTIHHHHIVPIFESSNSYTFEVNQQDINLSFPFHSGTINYLNREKPKFVERYAEVMGFVLSAFVLVFGLGASLKATMKQRKKDRMDEYYKDLLEIKETVSEADPKEMRLKLRALQKTVFQLLIDEKLSANNEFLIFMMLWNELSDFLDKQDHTKELNEVT